MDHALASFGERCFRPALPSFRYLRPLLQRYSKYPPGPVRGAYNRLTRLLKPVPACCRLWSTLESTMNQLSLAGTRLEHFHVCAFFNSRDEEFDILAPFFKEGIEQGEKNLHIINPEHHEDHRARLRKAGIDTHACEACGQLEILPWK